MTVGSKFHREPNIDHALVSQATHRDAQPVNGMKFETYREELDHWISKKKRTEADLVGYSKAAFSSEQARIRRKYASDHNRSFNEWIKCKSNMEERRRELVRQCSEIENEIIRLKPLVAAENARMQIKDCPRGPGSLEAFDVIRDDGTLSWDGVAAQLLIELRMIRGLLEEICDRKAEN